jgi:hypothetical protein
MAWSTAILKYRYVMVSGWNIARDSENDSPSTGNMAPAPAESVEDQLAQSQHVIKPHVESSDSEPHINSGISGNVLEGIAMEQAVITELDPLPESPIAAGPLHPADKNDIHDLSPAPPERYTAALSASTYCSAAVTAPCRFL